MSIEASGRKTTKCWAARVDLPRWEKLPVLVIPTVTTPSGLTDTIEAVPSSFPFKGTACESHWISAGTAGRDDRVLKSLRESSPSGWNVRQRGILAFRRAIAVSSPYRGDPT